MAQSDKPGHSGRPRGSQGHRDKATHDPLLALTTGPEPIGKVSVDGRLYDMADPAHFTLRQAGHLDRAIKRIRDLEAKKDPTPKDDDAYHSALREVAGMAVPEVSGDDWAKMGAGQLADLAVSFFGLAALRNPRLSLLRRMERQRSPGPRQSRTSRSSTAAPQSAQGTG